MLQHEFTTDTYYEDGVIISKEEYDRKYAELIAEFPDPEPCENDDFSDFDILSILLGE